MKAKDSCKVWTVLLALVAATYAVFGAPSRSRGVPNGWIEDFEEAKSLSAKEGKHILMCSVRSDRMWDKRLIQNVFSQSKFTGKAKKRFVIMMADFADDARNLSTVAMRQNPDIRDMYRLYGNGTACVIDCDGHMLQRLSDINGDALSCWLRIDNETLKLPTARKKGDRPQQAAPGVAGGQRLPVQGGNVVPRGTATTSNAELDAGNACAVAGDWKSALEHFKATTSRQGVIAKYELGGTANARQLADAWWKAMLLAHDADTRSAYQAHAAALYQQALSEGILEGERKAVAMQRIAEAEKAGVCSRPDNMVRHGRYCVIDLSAGPNAEKYPVFYLGSEPSGGWTDEFKTTKLVLRRIEPGTFIMGENQSDESHRVTITKPFYIGVFETTQKQWELVTGTAGSSDGRGYKGDMRPVTAKSYNTICGATEEDAPNSFIGRLRTRSGLDIGLPTEAQWEYACRAGTKSGFNNGGDSEEDMFKVGRFANNQSGWYSPWEKCSETEKTFAIAQQRPDGKGGYSGRLTAVGAYLPNKWGLYDMHGNVAERCRDLNAGKVFGSDPVGLTNDRHIAWRGGGWIHGVKFHEGDTRSMLPLKAYYSGKMERDWGPRYAGFRILFMLGAVPKVKQSAQRQIVAQPAQQPQKTTPVVSTQTAPAPVVSMPIVPQTAKKLYCVIDLSGGPDAASYPVSQLDAIPGGGWSDEYKTTKLVLRRIEPGTFIMGKNQSNESRRVNITKPFYMGVFEVTQKQYELVTGNNPSEFQGAMRPVGGASFNDIRGDAKLYNWPNVNTVDANSFVGRIRARTGLNLDLPPETEWEYACRAGTTSMFNNGSNDENDWVKVGRVPPNQSELGYKEPMKYQYDHRPDGKGDYDSFCPTVGMYLPNAWGLYDMHGNLWEWTLEWAPLGSSDGKEKVVRGGCWNSPLKHCASFSYSKHAPHDKWRQAGFRLFISTTGGSEGHLSHPKRRADSVPVASSQPEVPTVQPRSWVSPDKLYCVIDLSVGASAASYPVSYLKEVPGNEWPDEYKTKKLVLRCVEPGTFIVGSTGRRATISKPYYIGVFEVTQSQWELVMGENPSSMKGAMRPVEGVSFATARGGDADADAASFVGRLRTRTSLDVDLPDPERWEYARRAGTTSKFNNGCNSESEEMWQLGRFYLNQSLKLPIESAEADAGGTHQRPDGRGGFRTGHTAAGSYLPNNWRLYDMHGNVAEMCLGDKGICVLRGGSWADSESRSGTCFLTSSAWKTKPRNVRENWIGLRLVIGIAE